MTLGQLQQFVRVVEAGSMANASRQHDIEPALLSRAVRLLEDEIGAELLNRTVKGVDLTATGRRVYGLAKIVMDSVEEMQRLVVKIET